MVNSKKFGFSLVEAMIVVVVLAIGIVAMTPTITKKIVNKLEYGVSLTGNSHGRYEVFVKEIYSMGAIGLYEKTIDETKKDGIVLYERKTNPEMEQLIGYSSWQYKDPNSPEGAPIWRLYEEFTDVTPHRNSKGEITHVTFTKPELRLEGKVIRKASTQKVAVGGRYVIENQNVVYRRGSFQKRDGQDVWVLDKDLEDKNANACPPEAIVNGIPYCTDPLSKNWRIIEGQSVSIYSKLANANSKYPNSFFEIYADGTGYTSSSLNPVKSIPWERMYDGNKLVLDRQIPELEGKFIAFLNPTNIVKNATIHAVGGGGAGGGVGNTGAPIFLTDLNINKVGVPFSLEQIKTERNYIKNDLTDRFVELIIADKFAGQDLNDTSVQNAIKNYRMELLGYELVKFVESNTGETYKELWKKQHTDIFGPESNNTYIVLNLDDGTINVKMDRRKNGFYITPDRLLQYTHTLGTGEQPSQKWNMPRWDLKASGSTKPWGSTENVSPKMVKVTKLQDDSIKVECYNKGDDVNASGLTCSENDKAGIDITGNSLSKGSSVLYNHFYTWSVPYATNRLKYGTSGEPGAYTSKTISLIENKIAIELGKGGEWPYKEQLDSYEAINTNKQAPNGTDSIVKTCTPNKENDYCSFKNLEEYQQKYIELVHSAPGGRGGESNLYTHKYDLCWNFGALGECSNLDGEILKRCCSSSGSYGNSAYINATSAKTSLFENIRAIAGMSQVVGIGAGRGAQGAHSVSGDGVLYGTRVLINSSNPQSDRLRSLIRHNTSPQDEIQYPNGHVKSRYDDMYEESRGHYENLPSLPKPMHFKGGDGAVIITW